MDYILGATSANWRFWNWFQASFSKDGALLFTRGQSWPSVLSLRGFACVSMYICVYQSRVCPRHNSSPVHQILNALIRILIFILVYSGSGVELTVTYKVKFNLQFQVYRILSLWTRWFATSVAQISKLVPQMHRTIINIPVKFGLDWPQPSISFAILKFCSRDGTFTWIWGGRGGGGGGGGGGATPPFLGERGTHPRAFTIVCRILGLAAECSCYSYMRISII